MDYKFKRGQLVEITKSYAGNEGKRFVITDSEYGITVKSEGKHVNIYKNDLPSTKEGSTGYYVAEAHIKLVNPDNDEESEFTFEELMLDLKQGVTA